MNAKEKNIINTLKIVSAEQDKLSRAAQKDNQHMAALYALTIAIATSEAAKVIEEQSKEIDTLKTQSTVAAMNPSSTGRCIYILGSAMMLQYTIIAELHGKYLITPYHTKESELLTNLRLIERSQAVFIDDAQRAVFNA
ncbi:hypothetical protein ICJ31_001480 [Escherichia coli]|nr:hypothetical protein [Escherichia coli]